MSSDDTRITTDDLLTHATPTDAANLEPMDGHPWEGDVGLAATMSDAFGQTQLVFTHGDTIIWGEEIVRAQLAQPDDGGMVPAVDFAALGWSVERAQTWLLGRLSQQRRGTLDLSDLAELAAGRVTADPELASMAGWDGDQLDDVLNTLAEQQAALNTATELDDVDPGPPPADPVTRPGDVWLLGPHRLVCGDSTDSETVAVATGGRVVELVHADPPYGMGKEKDGVANDNLYGPKLDAFQMAWWSACRPMLADNGSVYVWGNPEALWRLWYVGGLCDSERLSFRNEIVWDKREENPTMLVSGVPLASRRMFHPTERCLFFMLGEQEQLNNAGEYWDGWEPIRSYLDSERQRLGWTKGDVNRITNTQMSPRWFSKSQWSMPTREHYEAFQKAAQDDGFKRDYDEIKRDYDEIKRDYDEIHAEWLATRAPFDNTHDNMTDVWSYPRVTGDDRHGHATPKPVDMMARILKSSTTDGGTVLCPFGGTGPELIAAEMTGRTYFGVELSPAYCDVICRRYQTTTGIKPVLESTGEPHDFGV